MPTIISEEKKILFIHIPKNAGTTISNLIYDNLDDAVQPIYGHARLSDISSNNFYKFCIVRNPWDRAVSMWKHFVLRGRLNPYKWTFESFLLGDYTHAEHAPQTKIQSDGSLFTKTPVKVLAEQFLKNGKGNFIASQFEYIKNKNNNIDDVDLIIKFEDLSEVAAKIKEDKSHILHPVFMNGIKHSKSSNKRMLKVKWNNTDDYKSYYNNELRDKISDICKNDIELFNYNF